MLNGIADHVARPLAFRAADCCALRRGHVPDIALILQRMHQFESGICLRSRPTFRRMVFCYCSHSFANRKQQRDMHADDISRAFFFISQAHRRTH